MRQVAYSVLKYPVLGGLMILYTLHLAVVGAPIVKFVVALAAAAAAAAGAGYCAATHCA